MSFSHMKCHLRVINHRNSQTRVIFGVSWVKIAIISATRFGVSRGDVPQEINASIDPGEFSSGVLVEGQGELEFGAVWMGQAGQLPVMSVRKCAGNG